MSLIWGLSFSTSFTEQSKIVYNSQQELQSPERRVNSIVTLSLSIELLHVPSLSQVCSSPLFRGDHAASSRVQEGRNPHLTHVRSHFWSQILSTVKNEQSAKIENAFQDYSA